MANGVNNRDVIVHHDIKNQRNTDLYSTLSMNNLEMSDNKPIFAFKKTKIIIGVR